MLCDVIRPGEDWGAPTDAPPDVEVHGRDADLADAAAAAPGALVRFVPAGDSDVARAIGLDPNMHMGVELALDLLLVDGGTGGFATNMVVIGIAPDQGGWFTKRQRCTVEVDGQEWWSGKASAIVIATGEFLRGVDVVPRGHPGDGRVEVQVYAVKRDEYRAMQRRLATGTHLPHPRIAQRSGLRVRVRCDRPAPLEVDGEARPAATEVALEVVPAALRLLV